MHLLLHVDLKILRKFSITPGCIEKIPLNPPLQKGEEVGMLGLIENLRIITAICSKEYINPNVA
jgi:hypothetical protein